MTCSKEINDQYFCIENPPVQCVDIRFVSIVNGRDTQRHLDQILLQTINRVGPINRVFINNNPRFNGAKETKSTLAHVELVDHNNHKQLANMLNGYLFHGNHLDCSAGRHVFHGMDFDYRLRGIDCTQCTRFGEDLYRYENEPLTPSQTVKNDPIIDQQTSSMRLKKLQECSMCHRNGVNFIKPSISRSQVICTHWYCQECFEELTTIEEGDYQAWDGYATVSFIHRFKAASRVVWSCQLCRATQRK